ncbi:LLM class flavin-dependent oxidoreductase [Cytobacillus purgationiresistens]|uniref:Luciferase family oxidoreductase group 1 n=1 Tax=Cytobacillus purgationiresistens TaxID=863449 RepID=A0ABU0AC57_9BACI|nr:LLM class flavin-dependent oxidoreductase [Cytobacillus purgationiresistens]MDQ0268474.1 luciferase family oxidoreductase group 1 [Cytobacillus purgationiresistens]
MKLSILDQSPISSGSSASDALDASLQLAKLGDKLGYTRYWIAEHHDLPGLASSAPEIMLSYIGAQTNHIRLGAGAILLPHYKPFKIAETFNLIGTLLPDRVDLGIGRAPGGSAEASIALSGNYLEGVRNMPHAVKELLQFLHNSFPQEHMFSKVTPTPVPRISPEVWILGTSEKSALLAAENGTAYAFGQFMSAKDGAGILKKYKEGFADTHAGKTGNSLITVSAICAETTAQAEGIASSQFLWKILSDRGIKTGIPSIDDAKNYRYTKQDIEKIAEMKQNIIVGNPFEVKTALEKLNEDYHVDEIMIVTITHDYQDRLQSYQLISDQFSR